ncbi:MAG: antitoxin [Actinomycetota bacterium]
MGLLDTIKGLVKGNKKTITEGVDKAADLIQSKTSDDVDAQVEKGAGVVKDLVEKLDDGSAEQK